MIRVKKNTNHCFHQWITQSENDIYALKYCKKCGKSKPSYRKFKNIPVYECERCGIDYKESRPRECLCKCEDFIFHASGKEFLRWRELQLMERGKVIAGLKRQVSMPVKINSVPICRYVADAVYYKNGKQVIEDSKGMQTPEFKLKRKAVEAYYGIQITIT